jgi:hypothetical protein
MRALLVFAVVLAGCPSFKPQSGKLKCATDSQHRCPDGYSCIAGTCWSAGTSPDLRAPDDLAPSADLTPPADMAPRARGAACGSAGDCATGFCVDGVCCDRDCSGDACYACNLPNSLGVCAPVPVGAAPLSGHATCGPDDKSTCNRDGTCDGAGACRKWAQGTVCGAGSCNSTTNMVTSASTCDGQGTCVAGGTITCAPYVCKDATTCWPSCTTVAQCSGSNSCTNQSCGLKVNGTPCTADNQCSTGFCTDSYCCDMRCNGQCQACDLGGSTNGKCSTVVSGQPHGARSACTGSNVSGNVCAGQCDGSSPGMCSYPGSSKNCLVQSCSDRTHVQPAEYCNGGGGCATQQPGSCGQFICSGSACLSSCAQDSDCALGTPPGNSVYCMNGTCTATLDYGASCTRGAQCTTNCCCPEGPTVCDDHGSCISPPYNTNCLPFE